MTDPCGMNVFFLHDNMELIDSEQRLTCSMSEGTVCEQGVSLFVALFLPNRCTIDDELLHSIDPKQSCNKLVIEGSNGTGTTIELLSCEIEVLAYMPGIEVNQPIGSFAIPPGHSVDDAGPDEGYSRFFDQSLAETGFHEPICHVRASLNSHETVREC